MRHIIFCALMLCLALAACGRKAPLEAPPGGVTDPRVERDWKE